MKDIDVKAEGRKITDRQQRRMGSEGKYQMDVQADREWARSKPAQDLKHSIANTMAEWKADETRLIAGRKRAGKKARRKR